MLTQRAGLRPSKCRCFSAFMLNGDYGVFIHALPCVCARVVDRVCGHAAVNSPDDFNSAVSQNGAPPRIDNGMAWRIHTDSSATNVIIMRLYANRSM
jgi:hypothetical protein